MTLKTILCCFTFVVFNAVCYGETIRIPVGQQNSESLMTLPTHGQLKDTVLAQFGEPEVKTNPVGEPPISHWIYPNFMVYFEYNHVIHAVRKFVPKVPDSQK